MFKLQVLALGSLMLSSTLAYPRTIHATQKSTYSSTPALGGSLGHATISGGVGDLCFTIDGGGEWCAPLEKECEDTVVEFDGDTLYWTTPYRSAASADMRQCDPVLTWVGKPGVDDKKTIAPSKGEGGDCAVWSDSDDGFTFESTAQLDCTFVTNGPY